MKSLKHKPDILECITDASEPEYKNWNIDQHGGTAWSCGTETGNQHLYGFGDIYKTKLIKIQLLCKWCSCSSYDKNNIKNESNKGFEHLTVRYAINENLSSAHNAVEL